MAGTPPTLRIGYTLEQCWHRVPGGTARAALAVAEALWAMDGVELVGVAARHGSAAPAPWTPSIPVGTLCVPRSVLYETWHRFRWPRVERATGPVDVIHATGIALPPRTVPLVVTCHDLAFLRYPDYFTTHGLRFFHAALERTRDDADLVLCSSQATRNDAAAAGIGEDRLRVVELGVTPVEVSENDVAALRRRLGIPGRYVLHLGTSEPRKNRAALRRVASRLPSDTIVVLAGGSGWGDAAVATSQGSERVVDVGFVTEHDKAALLEGAAAFCYPSFWEGFGLPVLEAMAHRTPVVTSVDTSLAEVAGDTALLVDPHDDDAIASALCELLEDAALADRLAAAGAERAADFTWSRTARATRDAYREVATR